MYVTCLDLEGVLVPEIWIAFAEETGIAELKKTTRDEPDYDKLMKYTCLEDNEQVELRFFAGEASEVILLLLCNLKDGEISKHYYEELIQTRKKYKEETMKESDV